MTNQHMLSARKIRQQMASDPHRPQYHFQPPSNWMNDPNGLIQYKETYHLFYQYNPYGPLHGGPIHWGHAASKDLIHWQDFPIALAPTPDGPDKDGCWSGCAVNNNGVPTLLYTGVFPESQCVATGSPAMVSWSKYAGNPVIPAPPKHLDVTGFRDPCVWREADTWYMVLGSGIKGVGGAALLYRSPDLINWKYMHPLHIGDKNETGEMWECPSFFPLGDKYVLFFSNFLFNPVEYFTGTYQDHKFEPEYRGCLDHSGLFYAPQSFVDNSGRRLIFGWVREARSDELVETAGWSGMQSVPRTLTFRGDGRLNIQPASELEILRGQHFSLTDVSVSPDVTGLLDNVRGNSFEIKVEFEPRTANQFGLSLLRSPDGEEETTIIYDCVSHKLTIDRARSTANSDGIDISSHAAPLHLIENEPLKLHIFLDHSIIEVFANGHTVITTRVYPTRADSLGLDIFAHDGSVLVKRCNIWQLDSIWR